MNKEKLLDLLNNLEVTIQNIKDELNLDTINSNLSIPIEDYDEIFYEDQE